MERLRVMSRLRNLKDAKPCFNRIRVACDLSKEDREQIRKLVQKAKNLIMADETQKLRYIVRGKRSERFGTNPSTIFHTYMMLYLSLLLCN